MHLAIITPERTVLDEEGVQQVILPGEAGETGILPGHIAMVCQLGVGRIRVERTEGGPIELATSGGFAEVLDDGITILAETAERAEEIDVARARHARDKAREELGKAGVDDAAARGALSRSLNRLRIAGGG